MNRLITIWYLFAILLCACGCSPSKSINWQPCSDETRFDQYVVFFKKGIIINVS
jgi:hypothetical protein